MHRRLLYCAPHSKDLIQKTAYQRLNHPRRRLHRAVERREDGHEGEDDVGSGRGAAVAGNDALRAEPGERPQGEPDGRGDLEPEGEAVLGRGRGVDRCIGGEGGECH